MTGRLYRSRVDRAIGGVAGGVAAYLNFDPSIVRIIWAVLVFATGGLMLLVYVVMWIVVPEAPRELEADRWADASAGEQQPHEGQADERRSVGSQQRRGSGNTRLVFGLLLIGLGIFFLVRSYLPAIDWDRFWPIVLVLVGAALLIGSLRGHEGR